jgi:copper chaperone NosL
LRRHFHREEENAMKKHQLFLLLLLSFSLGLASACGQTAYEPQAIREETDRCAVCNMAVKDDAFAAQLVTKDGQSLKFDDIGCMHQWMAQNPADAVGAAFVRDYESKRWVRLEKAYYVYDPSLKTPMAYGVVAFRDESAARSFIEGQGSGKLMTAEELSRHEWKANRDMNGMMHNHSGNMAGGNGQHGGEMVRTP